MAMGVDVDERRQADAVEASAVQLSSHISRLGVEYKKYALAKPAAADLVEDQLSEIEQVREASIQRNKEERARLWADAAVGSGSEK